ncbi:oxidoreductase [Bryobacterales bacterium F-183]|nr:oxidoreductase [Bryobacterales bacterium F-183]
MAGQHIAVLGATGYVGGRLVPRLLQAGYPVRCIARYPAKLAERDWTSHPNAQIAQADLDDVPALTAQLKGCDSAFYLVHSMLAAGSEYAAKDRKIAESFAQAARDAGVKRIIYLGGLGELGSDLSEHLRSRQEVETALRSTGLPVTVLRAAMIIGSGSASFEILRYLVNRLPVMVTPKWVTTECQPISIDNVLQYLIGCLDHPHATQGETFDIGGADVLPYSAIMRIMAEELRLPKRWIIPVPVLTPRLSSYWIHLVTPLSADIARPLAEGLRNPVVCRDKRILNIVPQRLLSTREAIQAAFQQIESMEVETSWSMAGHIPGDPDWAGGKVFRDARSMDVETPDWSVYQAVCRIGGRNGWAMGWLWKIRGVLDRLAGGPGLRRGRRHPTQLRFGEALDFWRVVGIEHNRRLTLRAEMRLPGEAVLDFEIEPLANGKSRLSQTALFQPRGLLGLMYWWAVYPFHHFVFQKMLEGLAHDALRITNSTTPRPKSMASESPSPPSMARS